MNERERILELIKDGVLSTEEGLDLLESLAKKENKRTADQEFNEYKDESSKKQSVENDDQAEDEIKEYSDRLQEINKQLNKLTAEKTDVQTQIDEINLMSNQKYNAEVQEITAELTDLRKELELVKDIEGIDNKEEIAQLNTEINKLEDQLDSVKSEYDQDNNPELNMLENREEKIIGEISDLQSEKSNLLRKLGSARMTNWTTKARSKAKDFQTNFENTSKDFKEGAYDTFLRADESIENASADFGQKMQFAFAKAKDAFQSFEWKERSFKVPTVSSQSEEMEWNFDQANPTILDFKNANGDLKFEITDTDFIKVYGNVTFYGKMEESSIDEAFAARSTVEADDNKLTFNVPNKRIRTDLTIELPRQKYDYLSLNTLNGNVIFNDMEIEDLYLKVSNGDLNLNNLTAELIEVKGTNGNIFSTNSTIKDFIVNTVHGDVRINGEVVSSMIATTRGSVRATLLNDDITYYSATTVSGDVKLAIPTSADFESESRTMLGKVKSRLSDVTENIVSEKSETYKVMSRLNKGDFARISLRTTSGNVLLKDTEK